MLAARIPHRRRRWTALVAAAAVGCALLAAVPPGAAAATTGNDDALQARVRAELGVFTGWLAAHGVRGYVGEVGWPNNADTGAWNALAAKWYADADAAGVWTTAWATGEWWGCGYKLSVYVWATCSTMDGPLAQARAQAAVIEAQAGADNRGVNVAGGEFGTPGPLEATSSFSNANPGAYDRAYHYDTASSFAYLAFRGIRLVRLPLRWERVQPSPGGPLDAAEVSRISAAVGRAQAAGLGVILDVHNYGAYWLHDGTTGVRRPIGSAQVPTAAFATLWSRLSTAFAAHTGVVGYGLMNEPVAMAGPGAWEQASQAALDAIRANGDTKLVLVPGYNWSGAQQWTTQHPRPWITDPADNIRYEAHHYWDRDSSGAYLNSYAAEVADAEARGYRASPGPPTISVGNATAVERAPGSTSAAAFTLSLSAPSATTVTVKVATVNGSAVAGSDYTALPLTTVSFPPGQTSRTVNVAVTGDSLAEGNETFVVNLSAPVGADLADPQGLGTIADDEGTPAVSVGNATVVEGPPGSTATATFTLSLSAPSPRTVSVNALTADGTAVAGSDYTAVAPHTVSFAPGQTTRTVSVAVTGDSLAEGDESFAFKLYAPIGVVLADSQAVGIVADDEGLPTISVHDAWVQEGAVGATSAARFTIALSAPAATPVSVKAATANVSAAAGSDYSAVPLTTLSFAPGQTSTTVTVPVVGDLVAEGNERFVINLVSPVRAVLADPQGLGTIVDDDVLGILPAVPPPTLSISNATVGERGPGATSTATFTLSLSAPSATPVSVTAATANASAVAGSDYEGLPPTTFTLAPGQTATAVTVPVTGDSVPEGNETFVVNLSSPVGATLADPQGLATIADDEGLPAFSVGNAAAVEGPAGSSTTAAVTILLSAPSPRAVWVTAATANGTAVAGSDYTALAPTVVNFAPGETTKTLTVPVAGDTVAEGDEYFVVNLSVPVGAVLADTQATVTVVDDEGPPAISVGNATVVEGATSTTATFTISLSAPAEGTVTVRAATANGTAVASSDYTALPSTTVSFAPGQTERTVTVAVAGDATVEANETFVVNLSSPAGAMLADAQGLGTIVNDD